MNFDKINNIFFIGIGGIGMSAIARYFRFLGKNVYGYDRTETELTKNLAAEGMQITYEDSPNFVPENIDLVVITPAIPKNSQIWAHCQQANFTIKKRAEVLGIISQNRRCLAVAGTHGKTSTSSLLAWLLHRAGLNPSAFLGGIAENFKSNFINGNSDWVVAEADEFDRSFLHLHPEMLILTSVDADHLDIYGTDAEVKASYAQLVQQIKPNGTLVIQQNALQEVKNLLPKDYFYHNNINVISYNADETKEFWDGQNNVFAKGLKTANGEMIFNYETDKYAEENLVFSQAGLHNVENATAALTIASLCGAKWEDLRAGLIEFKGISRRFEWILKTDNQLFVDDYAHHPTELNAAIATTRFLYPEKKLTAVFQPHLYSRTRDFVDGFAASLDLADEIILLDIYPARELPIEGVSSQIIFDKMKNPNKILIKKSELLTHLEARKPDFLLTMGAGDIGAMVGGIKQLLINSKKG